MATSSKILLIALALTSTSAGLAQVVNYEADFLFPEAASRAWVRVGTFDATRWLSGGILGIDVDLGVWDPPPGGEQDLYRRDIPEFQGLPFFVEWRCRSSAPSTEIPGTAGSVINSTSGAVNYHFTITSDAVRFWRSNSLPILYLPVSVGEYHTFRVEQHSSALYEVSLDGSLIDSGMPEGDFPTSSARIIWGAKMWNTPSINEWDYVRYGTIPVDGSGDFDSNGDVDDEDLYFFQDCLLGPDADGPGCRWADMNSDGNADGADIHLFVDSMLAP